MTEGVLYAELAAKITGDIWESVQRPKKDWTGAACCACDCENLGDFENAFHTIVVQGQEDTHNVLLHGHLPDAEPLPLSSSMEENNNNNNNNDEDDNPNVKKRTAPYSDDNDDDDTTTGAAKSPALSFAVPVTKKRKPRVAKQTPLRFAAVKTPGPFRWTDIMRSPLKMDDPVRMAQLVKTVKSLNSDWRTWMSDKYVLACKEKFGVNDINECLTSRGGGDLRSHPKRPLLKILKVQVGMHSDAFIEWSEKMASLLTTEWTDRVLYTAIESEWIWNDCNELLRKGEVNDTGDERCMSCRRFFNTVDGTKRKLIAYQAACNCESVKLSFCIACRIVQWALSLPIESDGRVSLTTVDESTGQEIPSSISCFNQGCQGLFYGPQDFHFVRLLKAYQQPPQQEGTLTPEDLLRVE